MHQRGLLDDTLVCFVTEMGRTPRINQYGGRDHWSRALSIAFAGAGCPAGAVIGATDKHGGEVTERLCTPYDYAATIYRKLGIPDSQRLEKPGGVTVNLTDGGTPIDHRSPFGPIATSVVGTHFSSLMPLTAKQAHHLSVVRSMTSAATAGHRECCQEFFKGYRFNNPFDFPDIGSVVEELLGTDRPEMPGYIFCPGINMPNAVSSTGFLPRSRAPWKLGTKSLGENLAQPGWEVQSLKPRSGLGQERFKERHRLLQSLDDSAVGASEGAQAMKENTVHALNLLTSPAAQAAFDRSPGRSSCLSSEARREMSTSCSFHWRHWALSPCCRKPLRGQVYRCNCWGASRNCKCSGSTN